MHTSVNTMFSILGLQRLLFVAGLALLLATWIAIYQTEVMFTESLLVGYYCCVTAEDLPAVGTLARSTSDFFYNAPGKYLPPFVFLVVSAALFVAYLRNRWLYWVPFWFVLINVLYLLFSFMLIAASWIVMDWLLGPQMSPYKGYERTWLGITTHGLLWVAYWSVLAKFHLWQHDGMNG